MKSFNFIAFCILFLSVKPINQRTIFGSSPFGEALKKSPHFLRRTWVQRYDFFLYPPNFLELFLRLSFIVPFWVIFFSIADAKVATFLKPASISQKNFALFLKVFCNALIINTLYTRENCIIFTTPLAGVCALYILYIGILGK